MKHLKILFFVVQTFIVSNMTAQNSFLSLISRNENTFLTKSLLIKEVTFDRNITTTNNVALKGLEEKFFSPKKEMANKSLTKKNIISDSCPRFAVISDIHFGNNIGEGPMVKVPKALKNIFSQKPRVDALFVVGDLTNYGQASQYDQILQVFNDTTIVPMGVKVYFMMGNHDHYGGDISYENYYKLGQPLHQYIDIKGYPFITMSMDGTGSNDYKQATIDLLNSNLEKASKEYPNKPIFVFSHVPCKGTVYGSEYWGTNKFKSILEKYPQVIYFSGHSHYPLCDPRSIYQEKFTSVNDGSCTYSEIDPGEVNEGIHPEGYENITEGVIVDVDKYMNVTLERWDTYRNEEILPPWTISASHDGSNFTYANCTGGDRPYFADNEKVTVSKIQGDQCTVTFHQATDDQVVHHYLIEILNGETVVKSYTKFSEYYLNSDMPKILNVKMLGIPTGQTLIARITAVDSYDNESDPILSESFTTEEYVPNDGTSKPIADLFDIKFSQDGIATDSSEECLNVEVGSDTPNTHYNDIYKMWGASFSGSAYQYYKIDYKDNEKIKNAFTNGFTFEVLYKPNNTKNMCPLSAQESGGAGIEQANGGIIQFYPHIDGSYKTLNSSVTAEEGKYYHVIATYDKGEQKVRIYVNGSPAGEGDAKGAFDFPKTAAQWVAIGGDAHDGNYAQFSLDGEILIARMYSKAVSRDEVYWMYKEVKEKKEAKYTPTPGSSKPIADLFDISFNNDGSAVDLSTHNVVITDGGTKPEVKMNEKYDCNSATFSGNSGCYYRIDYANDEAITNALNNGFAYETLIKSESAIHECPFSAQQAGGAGFEQLDDGTMTFYAYIGDGYKVLKSDLTKIPNIYYHLMATYNREEGKLMMYINGELASTIYTIGEFVHPATDCRWICIGGDTHSSTDAQFRFKGEVVFARMYGKSLNRDDAYWLYESLNKVHTNISNLKIEYPKDKKNIYDLFGRHLKEITTTGLYIINGKKKIISK